MSLFRRRPSKSDQVVERNDHEVEEEFRDLKSGYLTKKKLNSSSCKSVNFIDMSAVQSVMTSMSANTPNGFDIISIKEKTTLMAENKTECQQWIKNLQMATQYKKRAATLRQSRLSSMETSDTSASAAPSEIEYQPSADDPFDSLPSTPSGHTPSIISQTTSSIILNTPVAVKEITNSPQTTSPVTTQDTPVAVATTQIAPVAPEEEALYETFDSDEPLEPSKATTTAPPPTPKSRFVPQQRDCDNEEKGGENPDEEIEYEEITQDTEQTTLNNKIITSEPQSVITDEILYEAMDEEVPESSTSSVTSKETSTAETPSKGEQVNNQGEKHGTPSNPPRPAGRLARPGIQPPPQPAPRVTNQETSPQVSRLINRSNLTSMRKQIISTMPMMPALDESAETQSEALYDDAMAENQLSETSTVTVHDVDCGPVVVRIRTPSLTTPSDECSGLGAALPTAEDLYGEVVSRLDKPVDIRSKYGPVYESESVAKLEGTRFQKENESKAIRELRDMLSLPNSDNARQFSVQHAVSHAKLLQRGDRMQALHDLLQR